LNAGESIGEIQLLNARILAVDDNDVNLMVIGELLKYTGTAPVGAWAILLDFADIEDISDWAMDSMKWAVAVEIIKGRTEATIVPQGTSTRAEVATVLKRFIENLTISGTQLGSAW